MNISEKAMLVINLIKNAVSKSITGVSFVSIRNYKNAIGEVSNYLINVGIRYEVAKAKDIAFLENIVLSNYVFKSSIELIEKARLILIEAFIKPNEARSNGQIDAYTTIFAGVKVHNETGVIYVYGYKESKTIIIQADEKEPKKDTRSELTKAKDELRKLLKTGKFTQYAIGEGNTIKGNGETLEL